MTGRHIPRGEIEWGAVKDLSSSSSGRGGLEDGGIVITTTPAALQQSGDVVEVGREGGWGGEGGRKRTEDARGDSGIIRKLSIG